MNHKNVWRTKEKACKSRARGFSIRENAVYCFPNTIVSGNNAFYEKIWFTMQ